MTYQESVHPRYGFADTADLDTLDILAYGYFKALFSIGIYQMRVLHSLYSLFRLFVQQEVAQDLLPLVIGPFEFGPQFASMTLLDWSGQ